jgi:hypothetical protein
MLDKLVFVCPSCKAKLIIDRDDAVSLSRFTDKHTFYGKPLEYYMCDCVVCRSSMIAYEEYVGGRFVGDIRKATDNYECAIEAIQKTADEAVDTYKQEIQDEK